MRTPLTPDRVITAAARVADAGGLTQVSMRNVGKELGVEAMSLYHHVAGKEALLDGLADWVFALIDLPAPADPWRPAMTARAASARTALSAHPWSLGLIESRRTPGPNVLRHHNAVLGCLRHNGFSLTLASHAFSAIDAYVYGFVVTELNLPFDASAPTDDFVAELSDHFPVDLYPHLAELITRRGFTYADEFPYGLDLILDSLENRLARDAPGRAG